MTKNKRYIDDGFEAIEDQSFTDTETDKTYYVDYFDEIVDLVNEQDEELQNLKNQIKIYELFLDQNDLNIEWDLFCTLNHCVNEEDTGCQTCKYMGLVDGDFE